MQYMNIPSCFQIPTFLARKNIRMLTKKELMHDFTQEKIQAHGRIEHRKCYTFTALNYIPDTVGWPKLNCLVCIESQRTILDKTTNETRYYLSSLNGKAKQILKATKEHWSIEDNLHWRLDVAFNEGRSRTKGHGNNNCPENLAITRKSALAILDADTSRLETKNKRLKSMFKFLLPENQCFKNLTSD